METDTVVVSLRRPATDKSWGFTLQGGTDQGTPVYVQKIARNGISHRAGLEPGDVVIKICHTFIGGFTHDKVKAEILRAGNDLDFTVKKRGYNIAGGHQNVGPGGMHSPGAVAAPPQNQQSEIVEEHVWKHGGPKFKNVQPRSYKILEQQLPHSEDGGQAPSSIFDRGHSDRSPYLQAQDSSIQKVFGEQ